MNQHKLASAYYVGIACTGTDEKTNHFSTISRFGGLPALIISKDEIIEAHFSVDETAGSAAGNATLKALSYSEFADQCRTNRVLQQAIIKAAKGHGVELTNETVLPKTFCFVEDSDMIFDKEMWKAYRKFFTPFVPKDILNRADDKKKTTGPNAETGLIFGAYGFGHGFNDASNLLPEGHKPKFTDRSTIEYTLLSDPVNSEWHGPFVGSSILTVPTKFLDKNYQVDEGQLHPTRTCMAEYTTPDTPLEEIWQEYLVKRSPRSKSLKKVLLDLTKGKPLIIRPAHKSPAPVSLLNKEEKTWMVVEDLERNKLPTNPTDAERITNELSFAPDLHTPMQGKETAAKGLILPPPSEFSGWEKEDYLQHVFNILVAKDTDPTVKKCPVILLNNGSFDPLLKLLNYQSNRGMYATYVKPRWTEFGAPPIHRKVDHTAYAGFDVLTSNSKQALCSQAVNLMNYRLSSYNDFAGPRVLSQETTVRGTPTPDGRFGVAGFGSHGNHNKINLKAAYNIAAFAGKCANTFLITGGGDAHHSPMYSFVEGYLSEKGSYIEGVSVHGIVIQESQKGQMSKEFTHRTVTGDIYQRIGILFNRPQITFLAGGGPGSDQEFYAWMRIKQRFPELMKDKKLVVLDSNTYGAKNMSVNEALLRFSLGDEAYMDMKHDARAMESELGILYAGHTRNSSKNKNMNPIERSCMFIEEAIHDFEANRPKALNLQANRLLEKAA